MSQIAEKIVKETRHPTNSAALLTAVLRDDFGQVVLECVSDIATIRNFCVFYFPDLRQPRAVHSVWSGQVCDFWLRRHGAVIVNQPELIDPILEDIRTAPVDGIRLERGRPVNGDPAKPLYDQFGILERIAVASRDVQCGYQSFFLRSMSDGWLTDQEYEGLLEFLPLVHEVIGLRQRIVGSENCQFGSGSSVSGLRERRVLQFSKLSEREAEVCDCVATGMTVAATAIKLGIAETTVKTLRGRAYRKLNINSATQLMMLFFHGSRSE